MKKMDDMIFFFCSRVTNILKTLRTVQDANFKMVGDKNSPSQSGFTINGRKQRMKKKHPPVFCLSFIAWEEEEFLSFFNFFLLLGVTSPDMCLTSEDAKKQKTKWKRRRKKKRLVQQSRCIIISSTGSILEGGNFFFGGAFPPTFV